jgi:hypothetical protein
VSALARGSPDSSVATYRYVFNPAPHLAAWVYALGAFADVIAATPAAGSSAPAPQSPACSHPVMLEGHFDARAPNLSVLLKAGFEPYATANMLAQKYHFKILAVFTHAVKAFAIGDIDAAIIPLLQCEPSIDVLSFDIPTTAT